MKTIEQLFLRIGDSDWTWIGLSWLRPARDARIGIGYIVGSSILLGLPGVGVGAALLYFAFGRVSVGAWLFLFAAATMAELLLHIAFGHFWNRRADALAKDVTAG
jgi:hypothetical protein